MTRVVDGLAREGLVSRRPDRDDRRAPPEGRALLERARRRVDAISRAIERLPAGEREFLLAAAPVVMRVAELVREGPDESGAVT